MAILGAGLAGLTAARYLRAHGIDVRVFEASPHVSGLCRSEFDAEGFTYDCGAHFINSRLAAALGVAAHCRPMPRYEEGFWFRGKRYRYPFGLLASPRFVGSALVAKVCGLWAEPADNLADHFRRTMGSAVANDLALPLVAAWSGIEGAELSPAVAEKFSTGVMQAAWLRGVGWASRRTVAIGYSHEVPESPHVYFVYPEGGIGAICERIAEDLRDVIQTESPVEQIHVENNRAVAVTVRGQRIAVASVVNTAPLQILAKLVTGTRQLSACAQFQYRPMVFVNLRFHGRAAMRDVVTWTPEDRYPFFRVSDIGRALPWLVPEDKNQLTCDIGCQLGDEIWNADVDQLAADCLRGLEDMVPGISGRFLGARVVRTPFAYPVFANRYEDERRRLETGTGIGGLISVGRNGEFKHILMEDVYWRTRNKCRALIQYLKSVEPVESETVIQDTVIQDTVG